MVFLIRWTWQIGVICDNSAEIEITTRKGISMRRLSIFLLSITLSVFAADHAKAQTTLRYQFKEKDELQYTFEQETITTVKVKDKEAESTQNMIWNLSFKVLSMDKAGSANVQIKITRARMFLKGPAGKAAADSDDKAEPEDATRKSMARAVKILAAMELRAVVSPSGEIKNIKPADETVKAFKELGASQKDEDLANSEMARSMLFLIPLSKDSVSKGGSWQHKSEFKGLLGMTAQDSTYTYDGPITQDGVPQEKISLKLAMKVATDPKATVKMEVKDFKGTGHAYLDNKLGRLTESFNHQRIELQFEAMGMTSWQIIEQRALVRLK
jgi:hypothetical protein